MKQHKQLHTRLFRKTYRRRPNRRLQYLRNRKKTRSKQIRRSLVMRKTSSLQNP